MGYCPFCGSFSTKTVGGASGDPFDRSEPREVCRLCGREIPPLSEPEIKFDTKLVVSMRSVLGESIREAKMTFDADTLSKLSTISFEGAEYPICRYLGVTLIYSTVEFDGERADVLHAPLETTRVYETENGTETVEVKIELEIK